MSTTLEPLIARFAALSEKVSRGRHGADFCVADPDSSSDWLVTELEKDLHGAVRDLAEGLKAVPGELDGPGVTRLLVGLRQTEPARDSRRADVGFGYMDFDSLLNNPLWDLRYRLKDAVDAQRAQGVDVLAGADRAVLEGNNGEFLSLLAVPRGEAGRAKFRFTLDRLSRLAKGIDPGKPEACTSVEEIATCLQGLKSQLDWDVLEPGRMHYSDSGYEPSTYHGDQPNPDNLLWFFDAQAFDQVLWAMQACTPLVVHGVKTGDWKFLQVRREAADLAFTLKWSLVEMGKVGRKVLEGADPKLLGERKNGFARSYGDFLRDGEPGVLAQ
ncbi:MAG TPA: hypothetical protein VGK67_40985 [Myxococcales bacterium]|jgi:hypothetical protein